MYLVHSLSLRCFRVVFAILKLPSPWEVTCLHFLGDLLLH